MNSNKVIYDVLVIGGGFYGAYISEHFAKLGKKVFLCEKEEGLMQRASFANQARVHNGYHYPRSVLTALKSRVSFPRFNAEFKACIDDSFDKYYLIGKPLGKITAQQFQGFCKRIGAPCEPAPNYIQETQKQTWKTYQERLYSILQSIIEEGIKKKEFVDLNPGLLMKAIGGLFHQLLISNNEEMKENEKEAAIYRTYTPIFKYSFSK